MYKRSFYRNMLLSKEEIYSKRDKGASTIWLEVKKILEDGSFSSYKKAGQLSSLILAGYNDEYIARVFNIEETTLRVTKRKVSGELYNLFGDDFFDLLSEYKENSKELNNRLYVVKNLNNLLFELIPEEILTLLSTKGSDVGTLSLDLDDCKKEISFLLRHSIPVLKEELEMLDVIKLNYVLDTLSAVRGSLSDRYELVSLFNSTGKSIKIEEDKDV